jgi:hypothetical protein
MDSVNDVFVQTVHNVKKECRNNYIRNTLGTITGAIFIGLGIAIITQCEYRLGETAAVDAISDGWCEAITGENEN